MVKNYDDMLSHFHLIPERYGRTDGQTDRFAISISRVSMLTRDKNHIITNVCTVQYSLQHASVANCSKLHTS